MATSFLFNPVCLQIGDVVTSGKGAKTAPISFLDGNNAIATFESMKVLWEPSAFGDDAATRVNINWRPDEAVVSRLAELDEWIVQTVCKDSLKFFGKARGLDSIREGYSPVLKQTNPKFPPAFKAKMNLAEPAKVRIWDNQNNPRAAPQAWVDCLTQPRLKLKGLYFLGAGQFGAVVECLDIKILDESTAACPF